MRKQFAPGTKVMIAIGGWGDTKGFSEAARTVEGRKNWAANVAAMVKEMGADGEFYVTFIYISLFSFCVYCYFSFYLWVLSVIMRVCWLQTELAEGSREPEGASRVYVLAGYFVLICSLLFILL